MPHLRPLRFSLLVLTAIAMLPLTGCMRGLMYYPPAQRKIIDRSIVDYPGNYVLKVVLHNLTGPIDVEEDADGNLILLESGRDGYEPRLFCFKPDGNFINIYPTGRAIPDIAPFNLIHTGFHIYGPAGGLTLANGKIYVSHRDENGFGVITAFNYDGTHITIASNLPAQGDNGMSDIAVNPIDGRIWFAVGSATNSGVVGLDNWPWVKHTPEVCDKSFFDLKLNGYQFKSPNPDAGIFGGSEVAVTAPFEPFNVSGQLRIPKSETPTGAIYSADPNGGSLRVEAYGIHSPHGLAYNQFGSLYFTAGGMEFRGTRPIADDPDALLAFKSNTWYGFPDYSTDLRPITEDRFQPKGDMVKLLVKSGYPEISFLFDHNASRQGFGLMAPIRETLLQTTFPSLSGAGNFDFVPGTGPFKQYEGNAIIPLSGDHSPFATSGQKLNQRVGFKVIRFDPASREITDFIKNAKGGPASALPRGEGLLERPVAVRFGRDGRIYIVDFGRVDHKNPQEKVHAHTGMLFVLEPIATAATRPSTLKSSNEKTTKEP